MKIPVDDSFNSGRFHLGALVFSVLVSWVHYIGRTQDFIYTCVL